MRAAPYSAGGRTYLADRVVFVPRQSLVQPRRPFGVLRAERLQRVRGDLRKPGRRPPVEYGRLERGGGALTVSRAQPGEQAGQRDQVPPGRPAEHRGLQHIGQPRGVPLRHEIVSARLGQRNQGEVLLLRQDGSVRRERLKCHDCGRSVVVVQPAQRHRRHAPLVWRIIDVGCKLS
jgi:hypothetical protein